MTVEDSMSMVHGSGGINKPASPHLRSEIDPVEFARDALARERRVDHQRQALPRAVIDHDQDAEAPTVVERVGDEVEAPALVRLLRHGGRCPRAKGSFAPTPPAHGQPLLPIEAEQLLVVQREALPSRAEMSRRR